MRFRPQPMTEATQFGTQIVSTAYSSIYEMDKAVWRGRAGASSANRPVVSIAQ